MHRELQRRVDESPHCGLYARMESKSKKRRRRVVGWIGIPGFSLWGALRTFEWLFSLGGAPENAEGWRKAGLAMLSTMPSWLMPALLAASGVALVIYLVGVVPEFYGRCRQTILRLVETPEGVKLLSTAINVVMGTVTAALVVGLIYYLVSTHERTKTVWSHPTLSAAEQEHAKAECKMKAIEVGGSGAKIHSPRFEYERACLTSKGFALEEILETLDER